MTRDVGRFIVDEFTPVYLGRDRCQDLTRRDADAIRSLKNCKGCPRKCEADRLADRPDDPGICDTGRFPRVSSAFAHFGEESCLCGSGGSGTIFFAGCNLHCVFCQNWDISHGNSGRTCTATQIADLMLALQDRRCSNINFVTPSHVVPQVIEAIVEAIGRGLVLPVVYNTSAYDSPESIARLDGLIDIYMPDFKLWSPDNCATYLTARDYCECAREAIKLMHDQVGDLCFTTDGLACRGLLVRHLVMPGLLDDSAAIFQWLAQQVSPDTFVNIMAQYHPDHLVGTNADYQPIGRCPSPDEIAQAHKLARDAGLWRFDQ